MLNGQKIVVVMPAYNAARTLRQTYDEVMASNAPFKKIYESMKAFRADQYLWFQVSEHTYDTFMMGLQRKKLL